MKATAPSGAIGRPQYPVAVLRVAASRLEVAASAALAATVLAFTLGSSSVSELTQFGLRLRWVCLMGLVPLAALLVRARPRPRRLPARAIYTITGVLLLLAFESTLWSVRPMLTLGRATSLLLLVAVAGLFGVAAAGRPEVATRLIRGLVVGGALVALFGFVLLLINHSLAVQQSSPGMPSRLRGLGQNPNTASLLSAILLPLASWLVVEARTVRGRALAGSAVVLLAATIIGSGSYGALGASFAGMLVMSAAFDWPYARRAALAAVAVTAFAGGLAFNQLPGRTSALPHAAPAVTTNAAPGSTAPRNGSPRKVPPPAASTVSGVRPGQSRLEDEIGSSPGGTPVTRRTLFGGSGRGRAWQGALELGLERPLAGYGFGTEEHVFVDRWISFNGSRPENSVIGLFLQLGAIGVLLLIALVAMTVVATLAAIRQLRGGPRRGAAACAGAVAAASALALVQSYVYSVGNVGSLPLWVLIFILAALSQPLARKVGE
jgi:hypothetical protein